MKSRYLKIPSKPRFTDNEPINQRRRNLWFLERVYFFPAVQSTSVEIIIILDATQMLTRKRHMSIVIEF